MTYKVLAQPHQADFQPAYNYLKGACEVLIPMLTRAGESTMATTLRNSIAEAEKLKIMPSVTVDGPVYRHPTDASQPRTGEY